MGLFGLREIVRKLERKVQNPEGPVRVVGLVAAVVAARDVERAYLGRIEKMEEQYRVRLEEAKNSQPNWATRRLLLSALGSKIADAFARHGRPIRISGGYLIADHGYAFGIFKVGKEWTVIDCRFFLEKFEEVGSFRTLAEAADWCRRQGEE